MLPILPGASEFSGHELFKKTCDSHTEQVVLIPKHAVPLQVFLREPSFRQEEEDAALKKHGVREQRLFCGATEHPRNRVQ